MHRIKTTSGFCDLRLRATPRDASIVDGRPRRRRPCAYPGARDAPVEERVDPLSYRCRAACRSRRSTSCAPSSAGRQNDRRRGRARSSGRRRRRRGSRRSRRAPSRALCWPARACPGWARLAQLQVLGAQVEAPCSSFSSAREARFSVLEGGAAPQQAERRVSFSAFFSSSICSSSLSRLSASWWPARSAAAPAASRASLGALSRRASDGPSGAPLHRPARPRRRGGGGGEHHGARAVRTTTTTTAETGT